MTIERVFTFAGDPLKPQTLPPWRPLAYSCRWLPCSTDEQIAIHPVTWLDWLRSSKFLSDSLSRSRTSLTVREAVSFTIG